MNPPGSRPLRSGTGHRGSGTFFQHNSQRQTSSFFATPISATPADVVQRQMNETTVDAAMAYTMAEIRRALVNGYVWSFEEPFLNRQVHPRRVRVERCRNNQLWRLYRLLERETGGADTPRWNAAFASADVANAIGERIGRDLWQSIRCDESDYPGRLADYIGARTNDSQVRIAPSYQERLSPRLNAEHPEIEDVPSAFLINVFRDLERNADAERYRDYVAEAGELELRTRMTQSTVSISAAQAATALCPSGDPGFIAIESTADGIALSMLTATDRGVEELESMPDSEALRYMRVLGSSLTGLAAHRMCADPAYRDQIIDAAQHSHDENLRYWERQRQHTPPVGHGTSTQSA